MQKEAEESSSASLFLCVLLLGEGILGLVEHALGLVEGDILDAQQLESLKEDLAAVCEGNAAVVGVVLGNQHVTVEALHLGDGEHADAAEGTGGNGQDFTLRNVGLQLAVSGALQAEDFKQNFNK